MSISGPVDWNRTLTTILVVCALVTTGLVVYRQWDMPSERPAASGVEKPTFVKNWQSYLQEGVRLGPPSAPVQLIEFGDIECPFCAGFHKTLSALRDQYPSQIAVSYIHFPLPGHRFAVPAARAAECAGAQGRFEPMLHQLYEEQSEFGFKAWSKFAAQAGVSDLMKFESCILDESPVNRIVEGKKLGDQLDVRGTPTLIINGWKLSHPPSTEELDRMVKAILAGGSPVDSSKTN